jgi:ribonuclease BN (tRNA processing enzyme)
MSELVFVGTSDAFGAGGRRQSAVFLRAPHGAVLIDCGGTTGSGLNALGIPRAEIDVILISHFHADHFAGVTQLLLASIWEDRRTRPLRIAGPRGIEARVLAAARALGHDFTERALPFPLLFQELAPGIEAEVGPVRVQSFETKHQPDACPHGFQIRAGRRQIVYSGDTGWFDELPKRAAGAELFVCECTFEHRGWDYHLSLEELAGHKGAFDCGRIVLTHLGAAMSARRGRCELETADDGMLVRL